MAVGGTEGVCPPRSLLTQNSAKNAPKHVISTQKIKKIFWGGGTASFLDPFPVGRGHLSPTLPLKCPHYN